MAKKEPLSAEVLLAIGRLELRKKWPYFSPTLMGLIPHPTLDIPTFAVTPGMVMMYNPEFVKTISAEMVASEMVHECSHVLRGHHSLFKHYAEADRDLVNIGMDLAINVDIRDAGWKLHDTWVFPEHYDLPLRLTAVEYIDLLMKQRDHGTREQKNRLSKGSTQKCFTTKSMEAVLDKTGRPEVEKKRIVKATVNEMQAYVNKGSGRGSLPGFMKDLITQNKEESRIPWRDRLEHLVLHASGQILSGGQDYSLRHPSHRSYLRGILRPGPVDQMFEVTFIIDTSASMNAKQMLIGMAEAFGILEQMGIDKAWYIQADTNVAAEPQHLTLQELRNIATFHGRGGTDFRPALAAAARLTPRPDIIFYFTDGDGWAPEEPPEGVIVVWCVIPVKGNRIPHRPAPWGEVVLITDRDLDEDDLLDPYAPP